jgi:dTMP kinase
MRNKGKLIVFEGIDGSGKGTQTKKLFNFLKNKGIKTELFEFPFYSETFFGKEVGNYLNGEFGGLKEIHPKLSAMLYAGDRYEKRDELIKKLNQGYLIICDRYVPSNIAHQTAKYNDIKEKNVLKKWIEELEYNIYKLPKPDLIFFLNMNPDISDKLILNKSKRDYTDKKKDLHENDNSYLKNVYNTFCEMVSNENWENIMSNENDNLKTIEEIQHEIIDTLAKRGFINE